MPFSEEVYQKYIQPELDKIDSYAKKLEITEEDKQKIKDTIVKVYKSGNIIVNKNLTGGIIFMITEKPRSDIGEAVGCSEGTITTWKKKVLKIIQEDKTER